MAAREVFLFLYVAKCVFALQLFLSRITPFFFLFRSRETIKIRSRRKRERGRGEEIEREAQLIFLGFVERGNKGGMRFARIIIAEGRFANYFLSSSPFSQCPSVVIPSWTRKKIKK